MGGSCWRRGLDEVHENAACEDAGRETHQEKLQARRSRAAASSGAAQNGEARQERPPSEGEKAHG